MKKIFLLAVTILGIAAVASAQPRAIGVRAFYGGELSYQHTLGGENFAELDLGWWNGGMSLAGAYDFSIAPIGPFNFFAGPALHLTTYSSVDSTGNQITAFNIGAGAQVGLEYFFEAIPLQMSLDWRPTATFLGGIGFGWNSFALGIRYAF